jgi:hypothetical protein
MADYDPQPIYRDAWERRFLRGYLPTNSDLEYSLRGPAAPIYPSNALTEQQEYTQQYDTPFDAQANQQGDYPRYDPGPLGTPNVTPPSAPGQVYDPGYPGKETFARAYDYLFNRPAYPSGSPPAPPAATSTGHAQGAAPGDAEQFMGVAPKKKQWRMEGMEPSAPAGVKGEPWLDPYGRPQNTPWQAPGGAPQPSQGGVGAASGGAAPMQPHGPLTIQGVMQSLAQANPEMMKTREGRITLGMAALKFAPLMMKEDQLETQRMRMELSNQVQMLKLQQGEAKLGMQEARLEAYESRLNAKGGSKEDKIQKEYDTVSKQANDLANHLAINKGDPNLKARYDSTMERLKKLDEQLNPPDQGKAYGDWIKSNPSRVEESVPDDVRRILNPQEFKELIDRQRSDPEKAYARIQWLRQKARGSESTVEKSYGNY